MPTAEIHPLRRDNAKETFTVAAYAMDFDEPLNYCAGITPDEFNLFLCGHEEIIFEENLEDLSCCAIDTETGKIVGGFFAVDVFDESKLPDSIWSNPKFGIVGEAMGAIHENFNEYENVKRGEMLKIVIIALLPEYRGQKLASRAVEGIIESARKLGYSSVVSETSSIYTRSKHSIKSFPHFISIIFSSNSIFFGSFTKPVLGGAPKRLLIKYLVLVIYKN